MRKLSIILLAVMLIVVGSLSSSHAPSAAQTATIWYWATSPEGLVAYTIDGQVNPISSDFVFAQNEFFAARLANDSAILRGGGTMYRVTPETAQIIPMPESIARLRPYSYRHPYVVLMETETTMPAAVLNVETLEIIGLAGELPSLPYFLPDGTTLRYVGAEITNGQAVSSTLYEQNVASSELTELMTLANDGMVISGGDGTYWWVEDENGEMQTIGDPDPQYTEWLLSDEAQVHGNWLWHRTPLTLDGYSLVDDATFTLTLPENMVGFPDYIDLLPDGSIGFVGTTDVRRAWVTNPDGTLLELGELDYMKMTGQYVSDDGQWGVAMGRTEDGETTTRLWDLTTREIVYEAPYEDYSYHRFAGDTVGIYYNGRSQILYWNGKATPLDLYTNSLYQYPDNFFHVLSGGQAFYEAPDGGIYRFDAATESMTLLVPDGKHISVYDLR